VNLKTGIYYTLNPCAERIWGSIDGSRNTRGIAARISKAYGITPSRALRDVENFLGLLRRVGVIRLA
jgi:hypothetical protein